MPRTSENKNKFEKSRRSERSETRKKATVNKPDSKAANNVGKIPVELDNNNIDRYSKEEVTVEES